MGRTGICQVQVEKSEESPANMPFQYGWHQEVDQKVVEEEGKEDKEVTWREDSRREEDVLGVRVTHS